MKGTIIGGVALLVVGLGILAYTIDRAWFHPTSADRQRMAQIADHGPLADPGSPIKLLFLSGAGLTAWGCKKLAG